MSVPIFIVLLFAAAVAGVYAWIDVDDTAKAEHAAEKNAKLDCAQKISELTTEFRNWKAENEAKVSQAVEKAKSAEAVAVDIRNTVKSDVEAARDNARSALDIANRAMVQMAKPQKIHLEGSLQLERPKKAEPRRSP